MSVRVLLTDDASSDLACLCEYIYAHDAPGKADCVLYQIAKAFQKLSENPERGAIPKELLDTGLREYRQIIFTPYRIIPDDIFVMIIADGDRAMQALPQQRLLRA